MKHVHYLGALTLLLCLFYQVTNGQAPQSFKYQSVARNSAGEPIVNSNIGLRISIRGQSETGTIEYQETHTVETNGFGLFSISIGDGTVVSGTFSGINWASSSKFLEVEADFAGGTNYTSMGTSQLLSVPYALYAASGTAGPQGPIGPQGPAGAQGLTGSNGTNGANGLNILNGTTNPTVGIGVNGEFYINTTTNTLFGPKMGGTWPAGVSLIGPAGAMGAPGASGSNGTNGVNGLNLLNGTTNPTAGIGVNGEFYLNTTTTTLFGPKAGGAWPTGVSLIGPTGSNGTNGINGLNILNGTTNPTAGIGVNGEFYINTTTSTLFGPKASGAWPAGVLLVGSTGAAGANGTNGLNILNGTSNPTASIGVNGEFYINTATSMLFGPKAGGVWPAGVSLIGPAGSATNAWNLTGNAGTVDGTNFIGTTDNVPLNFKVNNQKAGKIEVGRTFFGYQSGNNNTSNAVGLGSFSLQNNTGAGNTAVGNSALSSNTSGPNNTAVGSAALSSNTTGQGNTAVGSIAMVSNTSGNANSAFGQITLNSNTTGSGNTAVGSVAMGQNTTGSFNSAFGSGALTGNITGSSNTAIGNSALMVQTAGDQNTAVGYLAMQTNNGGSRNTSIGFESLLQYSAGFDNTSVGFHALRGGSGPTPASGKENTAIGTRALYSNLNGDYNTAIGFNAGYTANPANANVTGSKNTFIGYNSGPGTVTQLTNSTAIGNAALVTTSNSLVLGGTGINAVNVGIGVTAPTAKLDIAGSIKIVDGTQGAGKVLTSDANGLASWGVGGWSLMGNSGTIDGVNFIGTTDGSPLNFRINNQPAGKISSTSTFLGQSAGLSNTQDGNVGIGTSALQFNTIGNDNTAIGMGSLNLNSSGSDNTAIGSTSMLWNTTGVENTALGVGSLFNNSSGAHNTAGGNNALFTNTTGTRNSAFGQSALFSNTTGLNNTAIGFQALFNNVTGDYNVANGKDALLANITGSNNTALGYQAGLNNSTGSNNTFLGFNATSTISSLTNATAIGYQATVSASNSLVLGGTGANAVNVGIGVTAPTAKLDIAGSIKIVDGTQGVGKVLTSDGTGLASWVTPSDGGSGWGLTGNVGTDESTNFIGTTDNHSLMFRVNNQKAGRIDPPNGNVFLGYQAGNFNTSISNVAIGTRSLFSNSTGNQITAIGFESLYSNTTGIANTASGFSAQYSNTTGNYNTADGYVSLYSNTSGYANTAVGGASLYFNSIGHHNNAFGYYALHANTNGTHNTALGNNSLEVNASGNYNTGVGVNSLLANTLGNNNTALGYNAFSLGTNYSNSTAIGYNAQVTASNMIRLGDANVTSINGAVAFTVVSDGRFKKDIKEDVSGLPFIMKLRPVTYHLDMNVMAKFMKTPDSLRNSESEQTKEKILQTGFIAQEVERSAKELGYDFSGIDKPQGDNGYYGLRYAEFIVPLVKAVQEQQKMIDELKKEIELLQSENASLKKTMESRFKRLESLLEKASSQQ